MQNSLRKITTLNLKIHIEMNFPFTETTSCISQKENSISVFQITLSVSHASWQKSSPLLGPVQLCAWIVLNAIEVQYYSF